ncbi:hypothetical protein E2C01_054242 [Portunus trituberculatus]|uniref:Uncharacterized protein n=1 Tax=Portunus trituberculatus TaxID=210409 RepID=A0A5B7GRG3_PORTR|nr:hypothetical protein [Portunus trituberculatus]
MTNPTYCWLRKLSTWESTFGLLIWKLFPKQTKMENLLSSTSFHGFMTPDHNHVVNTTGFLHSPGSRDSVAYAELTVSPLLSIVQLNARQLHLDQLDSQQSCGLQ